MQILKVKTQSRSSLKEITGEIAAVVKKSGVKSGICYIYSPHTTVGVVINENADPDVASDVNEFLAKLIPESSSFNHMEGNSDSHIKAILCSQQKFVPVEDYKLVLGTWEGVFLAEFDGPRERKVYVKIIESY